MQYPEGSTVEDRPGDSHAYIRFENYNSAIDRTMLGKGEVYSEIFIVDNPRPDSGWEDCRKQVAGDKQVTMGKYSGYRGLQVEEGGDAGGVRFALCVEKPGRQIFARVTENNPDGPIANAMLDTFKIVE